MKRFLVLSLFGVLLFNQGSMKCSVSNLSKDEMALHKRIEMQVEPTVQQPLHRDSSVTMPTYFFKGEKRVLIPSYEKEYDIDSMLSKYVQSQIDPNAYDGCIFNYIIKYRVDTLGEIHDVVIVNTHSGEKSLDRQVKTAIEKLPLTPAIEGSQVFPIDIISRIKLDWVTCLTP